MTGVCTSVLAVGVFVGVCRMPSQGVNAFRFSWRICIFLSMNNYIGVFVTQTQPAMHITFFFTLYFNIKVTSIFD